MVDLYNYVFFSRNKKHYREIAREFKTTTRRVYMLAYGKKAKSYKDYEILKELAKREIIEGVIRG